MRGCYRIGATVAVEKNREPRACVSSWHVLSVGASDSRPGIGRVFCVSSDWQSERSARTSLAIATSYDFSPPAGCASGVLSLLAGNPLPRIHRLCLAYTRGQVKRSTLGNAALKSLLLFWIVVLSLAAGLHVRQACHRQSEAASPRICGCTSTFKYRCSASIP